MALDGALEGQSLHLFGVSGRGLAPLALVAQRLGAEVTGCDRAPEASRLGELQRGGIHVSYEHDPSHLTTPRRLTGPIRSPGHQVDALVATSVAASTQPEIALAARKGLLHHRTDLLAACLRDRPGIGVTGSHGKGTVAALTAAALAHAGLDPLTMLGVDAPAAGGIARPGGGPLVAEVDDSDLTLRIVGSEVAVVTNLDDDHPHLPFTLQDSVAAVGEFVSRATRQVIVGPSPRAAALAAYARVPVWRLGHEVRGRLRHACEGRSTITVAGPGVHEDVHLRLLTPHASSNAALALMAAVAMGADARMAAEGMGRLDRIHRRLEPMGQRDGVHVYDDFGGKHPTSMRSGLTALRRNFPAARLVAVFEPYGPALPTWGTRYAQALSGADRVVLAPAFLHPDYAHTPPPESRWWSATRAPVTVAHSRAQAAAEAMSDARPGDVVVFFAQLNASRSMALAAVSGDHHASHEALAS